MIWLNPTNVSLDTVTLEEVRAVAVDQKHDKLIAEYTDNGPHPAFVDVPERRAVIKLRRRILGNENLPIAVGDQRTFQMRTAPSGTSAPGVVLTASVVITAIGYKLERHDGAEQTIDLIAVSSDGAADPVSVVADGGA